MAGGRGELVDRVAREIAASRRARGLSQEGLASLLDIAVKNVQRIESGRQNLSLVTLERICRALDVPPERLLAGIGPAESQASSPPSALVTLERAGFSVRRATAQGRRPRNAVPVMTLRAAAGRLSGAAKTVEVLGWLKLPTPKAVPSGQFAAEVRGVSMEPRIPDGSIVLFGPAPAGILRGRVLLVSHATFEDATLGGPYALKKIESVRRLRSGRTRVELVSLNPAFPPIVLHVVDGDLRVVAEYVRVLAAPVGKNTPPGNRARPR